MATLPVAPKAIGQKLLLAGTWKNLFYPPERNEYTYFERASSLPFESGKFPVKAAWAADAAMLAYSRFGKTPMSTVDFESYLHAANLSIVKPIGDWSRHGTQGYFAANEHFAIMAFRGTEADDPVDAVADLDLLLVGEHDYRPAADEPHLALRHLALLEELVMPRCKVHRGFQRALNQVWEEVHSCITSYRKSQAAAEICFTGHSLGAALATLVFSRFDDPKMSLYTFGCPRVGTQVFCDRVLTNHDQIFRFVNLNDPVAHVPVEGGYEHVPAKCIRIDQDGNLVEDDGSFKGDKKALKVSITGLPQAGIILFPNQPAPEGVVDHSPARYCVRLWNCV